MKHYYINRSITKEQIRAKYLETVRSLGVLVPNGFLDHINVPNNLRIEKRYNFQVIADCDVNIKVKFNASKVVSEYDHLDSNGKAVYKDKTYYNSGEDCYQFQRQLVGANIVYDEAGNIVRKEGLEPDRVKQVIDWVRNTAMYTETQLDVYSDMKKTPDYKTIDQALANKTALDTSARMAGTKICAHAKDIGWPNASWSFVGADILRHYDENEFIAEHCHYYVFVKYNGKEYLTTFDSGAKAMKIDYPNVPMLYYKSNFTDKKMRELFVQEIKKHGDDVHEDFLDVISNPDNIEISSAYRFRVLQKMKEEYGICKESIKQINGISIDGRYSNPIKLDDKAIVDLIDSYNKTPYMQTPTVEYDADVIRRETSGIEKKDLVSVTRRSVTVCVISNGDAFYSTYDIDTQKWTGIDFQPSQKMISREIGQVKEKYEDAKKKGYFGGAVYSMLTVLFALLSVYSAMETFIFKSFRYIDGILAPAISIVSIVSIILSIVAIVKLFPTADGVGYVSKKYIKNTLKMFEEDEGEDVGKGYTEEKKHSRDKTDQLNTCIRLSVYNERKSKRTAFLMLLIANIVFYFIAFLGTL